MSADDESTIRIVAAVPAAATVRLPITIALLRCARTSCPALEAFDEIGSSSTKSNVESKGKTFPGGGAVGLGVAFGMGVGGMG